MKKSLLCCFAMFGTAISLSSIMTVPVFAAQISGHLDTVSAASITGWAWNAEAPEEAVSVEIAISSGEGPGANTFTMVQALLPREDLKNALGSENHSFVYEADWTKLEGETFTVTAAAVYGNEKTPLIGSFTVSKEELLATLPAEISAAQTSQIPESAQTSKTSGSTQTSQGPGFAQSSQIPEGVQNAFSAESAKPGAFLGEFTASGYCNCQKCSGGYTKTYSGTTPQADHTISADLNIFPIGTKLVIDGITYTVEDRGSGVSENRLDIYFASHAEALAFGTKTVEVYAPQ